MKKYILLLSLFFLLVNTNLYSQTCDFNLLILNEDFKILNNRSLSIRDKKQICFEEIKNYQEFTIDAFSNNDEIFVGVLIKSESGI